MTRAITCTVLAASISLASDAPDPQARPRAMELVGKVVPLASLVDGFGVRLDPDAAAASLAFVAEDGKVYLLLKDDGSRMFFKDERLLKRPMKLAARLFPDAPLLQVLQVQSLLDGKPHEVYYWCDVCVIRRSEKMTCECCGAPMELRETPVRK